MLIQGCFGGILQLRETFNSMICKSRIVIDNANVIQRFLEMKPLVGAGEVAFLAFLSGRYFR